MDFSNLGEILRSGEKAVELGANLESYNPLPSLLWIFVFIVIALIFIIGYLLKIIQKSVKVSEINNDNIKEILVKLDKIQSSMEKHNIDSLSLTTDFYKDVLNRRE
jgi:hypothetical protein